MPARDIRFRNIKFAYPSTGQVVLDGFDLTIPAGSSLAIVGQNGAGKTTLAKLLCRLYEQQEGVVEVDGVDLRELKVESWRERVTAVFQDFVRFELPLRDNVAPGGGSDETVRAALHEAGAAGLADLDTVLARGYDGGTDLSGGQWQRVALARALAAVREGAGVVLLDEPTAQLDVRGEAEIFDRILEADPGRHHHPDLAPLLHGAACRPHLRARTRARGRTRDTRRVDGGRGAVPHDVRFAGAAVRRGRRRRGSMSSSEPNAALDALPGGAPVDVAGRSSAVMRRSRRYSPWPSSSRSSRRCRTR